MNLDVFKKLGFVLLYMLFVNCNLNEDPVACPTPLTGDLLETEVTLVGTWKISGITADTEVDISNDSEDNPSTDIYNQSSDCSKDAFYTFNENRTYTYNTGSQTDGCTKSTTSGTWQLSQNDLLLVVSCGSNVYDVSFNEDDSQFSYTLSLDVQEVNGLLTSARITFTFSKEEN
ncbi:DUF5004 domain-containing protein [Maribacter sp. 4G9]|uniref:DUF5004 domain-containing protein n=1 Tax=Maribacter sp. 4G9 TaxID=1889777 RepID=UPI000C14E73C|nr:DUF5004 domain-containing protein [Maribacter sp. 4G9]PIB25306.1 hypothetical protein BFP75_09755 [Maribacter sp. 4G9]